MTKNLMQMWMKRNSVLCEGFLDFFSSTASTFNKDISFSPAQLLNPVIYENLTFASLPEGSRESQWATWRHVAQDLDSSMVNQLLGFRKELGKAEKLTRLND